MGDDNPYVLTELKRLNSCYTTLNEKVEKVRENVAVLGSMEKDVAKISDIRNDIAMLKIKSGIWGLLAGFIPVAILVVFHIIKYTQNGG